MIKKGVKDQSGMNFEKAKIFLKMHKKSIIASIMGALIVTFPLSFSFSSNSKNKDVLTLFGNVDIRQVDMGFRVFGKVEKLFVDEGDSVEVGQLIAVLDKVPYEELVKQSKARVAAIEASLKSAEMHLKRRYEVKPEAISREEYYDALYNRDTLLGDLKEAKAALCSNLISYNDTEMRSLVKGSILTRIREPGSVLNAGEPVFTISIDEPVWIRAYISEPNLGKIYPGMDAEVITDTKGGRVYKGYIGFISPIAEFTPKTVETLDLRTDLVYRLRVIIQHPDRALRQGMPVTIKLKPKNGNNHKNGNNR